jgi:phospholipase/lecithinase/hemolysin
VLRGEVIQQVNSAIASSLTQFGSKVIYYDVFSLMLDLIANKDAYGLTQPTTYYCDSDASDPDDKWTDFVTDGHASVLSDELCQPHDEGASAHCGGYEGRSE